MPNRQTKQRRTPGSNARARELRHEQTKAEQKLWRILRDRQLEGAKFRRQMPVGPYDRRLCLSDSPTCHRARWRPACGSAGA
ncbi:MAG: DUF559 domain-containing protein [Alphaproteobacteria bacterium]